MTSDDWSSYDAPDEVIDAFKHPQMRSTGLNAHTITKPVSICRNTVLCKCS